MGHFLLTNLLLTAINNSKQGRIINITCSAHANENIDFSDINYETKEYFPEIAYGQSKLANIYFTRMLSYQLPNYVKTVSVNPGLSRTQIFRHVLDPSPVFNFIVMRLFYPLFWLVSKSAEEGAQTPLFCALCPFEELESGKYYADCKVQEESFPTSNWKREASKLWEMSEEMAGEYLNR